MQIPKASSSAKRSSSTYIVREVSLISDINDIPVQTTINISIGGLVRQLCSFIDESADRKMSRLHRQVDNKLKSKIEQKKKAHGLKTDRSIIEDDETESMEMRM